MYKAPDKAIGVLKLEDYYYEKFVLREEHKIGDNIYRKGVNEIDFVIISKHNNVKFHFTYKRGV